MWHDHDGVPPKLIINQETNPLDVQQLYWCVHINVGKPNKGNELNFQVILCPPLEHEKKDWNLC